MEKKGYYVVIFCCSRLASSVSALKLVLGLEFYGLGLALCLEQPSCTNLVLRL